MPAARKAYINGVAATAAQLRELGDMLVDIHGQHAHQSLLKADAQRVLLDNQAGARAGEAKAVALAYKAWRALGQREEFETNAKNVLYRARAAGVAGQRAGKAGRQAGRVE
jgi:DNA repair protein RecN (Recombination protein N)